MSKVTHLLRQSNSFMNWMTELWVKRGQLTLFAEVSWSRAPIKLQLKSPIHSKLFQHGLDKLYGTIIRSTICCPEMHCQTQLILAIGNNYGWCSRVIRKTIQNRGSTLFVLVGHLSGFWSVAAVLINHNHTEPIEKANQMSHWTPLHQAVYNIDTNETLRIVENLLKAGAFHKHHLYGNNSSQLIHLR